MGNVGIPIIGRRHVITCRSCGCDENNACVDDFGPCAWVLLDIATPTGVCSRCADEIEWHPALMATLGLDDASTRAILRQMGLAA